ncbi:hypothetical protein HYPSUDRAFT_53079 [Hypholoma sublateritium FD-334 SS-4]|uniref:Uncharacterized protein n=1 Tax=Hypholoma sublateritium (strain FD-334 SS-4) TaxID=945553 RepID=A0A0D2PAC0_HYPSF|nr:hypothetical protein HYPSUDRAFT_53079 [Hypholoma sublateritium FD-334 SS-4]
MGLRQNSHGIANTVVRGRHQLICGRLLEELDVPEVFCEDLPSFFRWTTYEQGPWTLIGTQQSTAHSTTFTGAAISLHFNGSGIVVFGTVPSSNATNPPPTAAYNLDGQSFATTLPFAVANVPNQPLFATSSELSGNMEHQILINLTSVVARPYIFQNFFVFPNQRSGKTDGVVTSVPPVNSATASSTTASAKSTASAPTTSQAASNKSASPLLTPADAQKTIKILAGLLGIFVFFMALTLIIYAIVRRRALAKQKPGSMKSTDSAEKGRPGMRHISPH